MGTRAPAAGPAGVSAPTREQKRVDRVASDAGPAIVVSCEHGGARIPPRYGDLFAGKQALLHGPRGYDAGALVIARDLARTLDAPLFASTTSRLLIDLNRSPDHVSLFSEIMKAAPAEDRESAYARHYLPFRRKLERHVAALTESGKKVIHISSHSFAPVLRGRPRDADVCLLYDPQRADEEALCARWIDALAARLPMLKLRRNYPYTGRADGFCTWLRRHHEETAYLGITLEVNQRHVQAGGPEWWALREEIVSAFLCALGNDDAEAHCVDARILTRRPAAAASRD